MIAPSSFFQNRHVAPVRRLVDQEHVRRYLYGVEHTGSGGHQQQQERLSPFLGVTVDVRVQTVDHFFVRSAALRNRRRSARNENTITIDAKPARNSRTTTTTTRGKCRRDCVILFKNENNNRASELCNETVRLLLNCFYLASEPLFDGRRRTRSFRHAHSARISESRAKSDGVTGKKCPARTSRSTDRAGPTTGVHSDSSFTIGQAVRQFFY